MGPILVLVFLGVFALLILQAIVQRRRNPWGRTSYTELPQDLRAEVERVVPDFLPGRVRVTKNGDEARIEGHYLGAAARIDADFDPTGLMVEFEFDGGPGSRKRRIVEPEDLPASAAREIDRVLGDARAHFERSLITGGSFGGEKRYEVHGTAGEWKWEIEVSASGRLLELEKERRRR